MWPVGTRCIRWHHLFCRCSACLAVGKAHGCGSKFQHAFLSPSAAFTPTSSPPSFSARAPSMPSPCTIYSLAATAFDSNTTTPYHCTHLVSCCCIARRSCRTTAYAHPLATAFAVATAPRSFYHHSHFLGLCCRPSHRTFCHPASQLSRASVVAGFARRRVS